MVDFINNLDALIWATPLIVLIIGTGVLCVIAMKFGNVTKIPLQWKLLTSGESSENGISPFETFCTVVAYRVAVGNIAGVMVAIMYGGPGAVIWMIMTAFVISAVSYVENSLGQIYKVRQDGQYRGGPYYYMERGIPWKRLGKVMAVIFALSGAIGVPTLVTGPSANNIAMAFENSFGVSRPISGLVVALLLFVVISGGVRRIAKITTVMVPFMTGGYLLITILVLSAHAGDIPAALATMVSSAFNSGAIFGGMIGSAVSYGVKRAVNSSGSGFGETPPTAAAAETAHPATQGLVNGFSDYINIIICFCSGTMAVVTDCFNVVNPDGSYLHIGQGSALMAEQAATNTAGVVWVQEAANTALPIGGALIAIALTCFAYSTCIAYYYEGESGLAYLLRNASERTRKTAIWVIRFALPIFFFIWANVTAATAWAISEIMFGIMAWANLLTLLILLPTAKKVYDDYMAQRKAGIEEPFFNPEALGIKNCDIWMEINKDRIEGKVPAKEAECAAAASVTENQPVLN